MRRPTDPALFILAVDVLLAGWCLLNIPTLMDRAAPPFEVEGRDGVTAISRVNRAAEAGPLAEGDEIISWNGRQLDGPEHLELLADLSRIGQTVLIDARRTGARIVAPVTLVPFYPSFRFPLVYAVTGLAVFAFGMFLVLKRPRDPAARALHWALVAMGGMALMTQGAVAFDDAGSLVRRGALFLFYSATASIFLYFTTLFPVHRFGGRAWKAGVLGLATVGFTAVLTVSLARAIESGDAEDFHAFLHAYDAFHLYFLVAVALGLVLLVLGYTHEQRSEQRTAMRWILYGLLVGTVPFLTLVVAPQLFGPSMLVAEELATLFVLAIPLSFTVAFLRYRIFRVEVEAHRRLALGLIVLLATSIQVLLALVLVSLWAGDDVFRDGFGLTLAVAVVVILLNPLRRRLRQLLDEALFPARTSATRILQRAATRFHAALTPDELGAQLVAESQLSLPGSAFAWYRVEDSDLRAGQEARGVSPIVLAMNEGVRSALLSGDLLCTEEATHRVPGTGDRRYADWLRGHGFSLAGGVRSETGDLLGVIAGRLKTGRDPLAPEEVELFNAIRGEAAAALERLSLQERVILEQRERARTEELSRLRSQFVSSVSHDLRTPLTSIKLFAEMLAGARIGVSDRREYAEIVSREADRLGRMVNNILDFARLERGVKEYRNEAVDPGRIVRAAVSTMEGQARAQKAWLRAKVPRSLPTIRGDADALQDALVNLIANAFKYSSGRPDVRVEALSERETVTIRVADRGIGIPAAEIGKIFEPFYRVHDARAAQAGGAGLGLTLVKHTVEGHGGRIAVDSVVGRGTTFTITLPTISQPRSVNP